MDEMDKILRSLDEVQANVQGQALPVASISHSETSVGALKVRRGPAWLEEERLEVYGAAVSPGRQNPGVAVTGVTQHSPQIKLPSETRSATASGYSKPKDLTEVSAGSSLMAASESPTYRAEVNKAQGKRSDSTESQIGPTRTGRGKARGDKPPATELVCCGRTFSCAANLRKHKRTTKAHGARPVGECSCGKPVTRRDAMASHRRYCDGTTTWFKRT